MKRAAYGTWDSPISAEKVAFGPKRFGTIAIDGDAVYWEEMRPFEGGRTTILKNGKEIIPPHLSARSRVHEYGGASFTVHKDTLYFVNDKDQCIYVGEKALTQTGTRFADLKFAGSHLIAVAEKGDDNFLAAIDVKTGLFEKIASGHDFYASPTLSPDGKKLAFLTWDHPNMPWDGTDLWVGTFENGKVTNINHIAGGGAVSIFQPEWSKEGVLHYVSDKTGWWNLYRGDQPLCPMEAEFGLPQWIFGMSTYALFDQKIISTYYKLGKWSLATLPPLHNLPLDKTYFSQVRASDHFVTFITASPTDPTAIVRLELATLKQQILAQNFKPSIDAGYFSIPKFISYPTANKGAAYAYFYPPANKDYEAPAGTLPPLIVMSHGGPTGATTNSFSLKMQYWTSRGFALLDVDYRGSTGYGRAYRDALKGSWGTLTVEDCEAGAQYLIDQKWVDPKKIAITGGSAGGYTTLAALTFGKLFTVGASYYGVSDLAALAQETHKFESHYLDTLIAPYPERRDIYERLSPIHHVHQIRHPVIFFQGSEDKIVPLNQAEKMHAALKQQGILTDLVIYEGEQHGFRKAENIRDALERERLFYLQAWGI